MASTTDLRHLAERQHGVIADRQARDHGVTRSAWRHEVRTGGWERLTPQVVRRVGAPRTASQRALAAVLDAGEATLVSHLSGAALWGVPGFPLEPLQLISVRRRRTPTDLATVHLPRHLPEPFGTVLDGVPVVRPALLLLQLAAEVHPQRLARVLDHLWARRLLSGPSVRSELAPVMHRGRKGTAALRDLLDSLPDGYVPAASGLESRFASLLADAGLPPMRRQVDLGDGERWCGRVDFVATDVPLVVEVDGDRFHRALSDRADDAARQARLEAAGFHVERVSEHDVWHRGRDVARRVGWQREVLLARRRAA